MIHGRNKELLGLLFVGVGVVTGALLFYWIWEGQQEAMRPTSTDWPEWRQKEWERTNRPAR